MAALLKVLEFVIGLAVVLATLADVFATVLVPRRLSLRLSVGRSLRHALTPGWQWAAKRTGGEPLQDLLSGFAAFLLVASFLAWMLLLLLGFSLMAHALRTDFTPPLESFPEAMFQLASAMLTLGITGHHVAGGARALVVCGGLCGLGVATLTLTYILQIQQGLKDRDALVLTLGAKAGRPPSGVVLIETVGQLGLAERLGSFFLTWEDWCARLLHTHTAHPVLALFRSTDRDNDWVTALGAVLDGASIVLAMLPDGPKGEAEILHRLGSRTAEDLCRLFGLNSESPRPVTAKQFAETCGRLTRAGYTIPGPQTALGRLNELRKGYAGHIRALSEHLGVQQPEWITELGN